MFKIRSLLVVFVMVMVIGLFLFTSGASAAGKTVFIGGTMSLTGPYAEDSAAILAGFEDYVKYVNETKQLAPWLKEKWPAEKGADHAHRQQAFSSLKQGLGRAAASMARRVMDKVLLVI